MEYSLKEILAIHTSVDVNNFLKKHTGFTLDEKRITYENVKKYYQYVGNNASNYSTIHILKTGEKGLVERITNAIDAVLEKNKDLTKNPIVANDIVSKKFPRWYKSTQNNSSKNNACDAGYAVQVAFNDGLKNRPTIDIIDTGTGIAGQDFSKTILSLHGGNKINTSKSYLTGAFGHGGSTSLGFTNATLIISKYNGKYYFTIVKSCDFEDSKLSSYLYLTIENEIPVAINDLNEADHLIETTQSFIDSESGTFVRMIELDASAEWKNSAVSDYIMNHLNTELFNPCIPIRLFENRSNFERDDIRNQSRYVFGSSRLLFASKFHHKDKSGTLEVVHKNRAYKLNYYVILPEHEDEWASDARCKSIFQRFCFYLKPIVYTINGQYISSEHFTRLKNAGLSNLQYRLLVEINLDHLENDKYRFFTTNRDGLQNNEITKGFMDSVVKALANDQNLIELNALIAEKSMKQIVDDDILEKIKNNLSEHYNNFLKPSSQSSYVHKRDLNHDNECKRVAGNYKDVIDTLTISAQDNKTFYKNEFINFVLKTDACLKVNQAAKIICFVDEKQYYFDNKSNINYMNGRIIYTFGDLQPGNHIIQFCIYDKQTIESNVIQFSISKEKMESNNCKPIIKKDFSFNINIFDEKELIIDLVKNEQEKTFTINLCLSHPLLQDNIYNKIKGTDIAAFQKFVIEPMSVFILGLEDDYVSLEDIEQKNKMAVSYCRSIVNNFLLFQK